MKRRWVLTGFALMCCFLTGCTTATNIKDFFTEERNIIGAEKPLIRENYFIFDEKGTRNAIYSVYNFNIEKSMNDPTVTYYVDVETNELQKVFLDENKVEVIDEDVWGCTDSSMEGVVFYTKRTGDESKEIWRYLDETREKEMLFVGRRDEADFGFAGSYVWYGEKQGETYICPVNGDIEKDRVEVNSLFEEENRTGEGQLVTVDGVEICRSYDLEEQRYHVEYIEEVESEEEEENAWRDTVVQVNGKELGIWRGVGGFYFGYEGGEEWEIDCLSKSRYESLSVADGIYTVEDGVVIGYLTRELIYGHPIVPIPVGPPIYREVLIELNPDTGESRLLCESEDYSASFIGYRQGRLYVVKDNKVCRYHIADGTEEELFELPEGARHFQWQAGSLMIGAYSLDYKNQLIDHYKLEGE